MRRDAKKKEKPKHLAHSLEHRDYLDESGRRRVQELMAVYANFAAENKIEVYTDRDPIQSDKDLDQAFRAILSATY